MHSAIAGLEFPTESEHTHRARESRAAKSLRVFKKNPSCIYLILQSQFNISMCANF